MKMLRKFGCWMVGPVSVSLCAAMAFTASCDEGKTSDAVRDALVADVPTCDATVVATGAAACHAVEADLTSTCAERCAINGCDLGLPRTATDTIDAETIVLSLGHGAYSVPQDGSVYPMPPPGDHGQPLLVGYRIRPKGTPWTKMPPLKIERRIVLGKPCGTLNSKYHGYTVAQSLGKDGEWFYDRLDAVSLKWPYCGQCVFVAHQFTDPATGARGVTHVGFQLAYPEYKGP